MRNISCALGAVVLLCTTNHTEILAIEDVDTSNLSYAGLAAYDALSTEFAQYQSEQWELTSGRLIGKDIYTPRDFFNTSREEIDLPEGHDDWLPAYLGEIIGRTTEFCDVMSLYMPSGKFLTELNKALRLLADRAENLPKTSPIVVRFLFNQFTPNAMPDVNRALLESLTKGISHDANLRVWLGMWYNKDTWNHAKIIAVDGRYVHTGGVNMEEVAYLLEDSILDSFVEVEGQVTNSGHYFANWQWNYIKNNAHHNILSAEYVSAFPPGGAAKYPPQFTGISEPQTLEGTIPIISMGNQGGLLDTKPSVGAFVALFDAATSSIKAAQMDLGPHTFKYSKKPIPTLSWPDNYIDAFGRALMRGVNLEIILSNFNIEPEFNQYSAGWTCNEIASKIIMTIPKQFPEVTDNAQLREIVGDKLRIGFLRNESGDAWQDGSKFHIHAKFVSIDDICFYIGSENLYVSNLAEWGLVFDDESLTQKFLEVLYEPMYKYSYTGEDCNFDEIFSNLYPNDCTECIS